MNSNVTEIRIIGAALIMLEPLTASSDADVSAAAKEAHAALAGLMSKTERRRAEKIDALEKAQKAQAAEKNSKSDEVLRIIADDPSVRVLWSRSETRTGKRVTKVTFEAGETTEFVYDFTPWNERSGETTLTGKLAASCLYVNRKGYLALSKSAKQTILGQMDLHIDYDDDDDDYNHNIEF
jgi:hypothetical protein